MKPLPATQKAGQTLGQLVIIWMLADQFFRELDTLSQRCLGLVRSVEEDIDAHDPEVGGSQVGLELRIMARFVNKVLIIGCGREEQFLAQRLNPWYVEELGLAASRKGLFEGLMGRAGVVIGPLLLLAGHLEIRFSA